MLALTAGILVAPTQAVAIVRVSEFLADCPFSHRLPDDPIVFPGLPGASHMHSFFGATSTNAHTNLNSLQSGRSNCNPGVDLSSYWVPTLYNAANQPVEPNIVTFYYLGEGIANPGAIQSMPLGMRIVAGNAKATAPDATTISRWSCLHGPSNLVGKDFVSCPAGTQLESYLDFPQCWNGRDLDSADHKSHMAYPVNNALPVVAPGPGAEAPPGAAVPDHRQRRRHPAVLRPWLHDARRLLQRVASGRDGAARPRLHPSGHQVRRRRPPQLTAH